jgi:hypothetical protein
MIEKADCPSCPSHSRKNVHWEPNSIGKNRLTLIDPIELFRLCAANQQNSDAWVELLRRYRSVFKNIIRSCIKQRQGSANPDVMAMWGANDFFQNFILRLIENDCAEMKMFSGKSEKELLSYLARICQRAVIGELFRGRPPCPVCSKDPIVWLSWRFFRRRTKTTSPSKRLAEINHNDWVRWVRRTPHGLQQG